MKPIGEISASDLIGHWQTKQGAYTVDWKIQPNRQFCGTIQMLGEIVSDFTGEWDLDRKYLTSVYLRDRLGMIEVGFRDRDLVLELENEYFVIQTTGNGKRKYTRVASQD